MKTLIPHKFTVKTHDRLGVLERVLRVIRHRGGRIQSMEMAIVDNHVLKLSLVLVTEKSIEALQSQIAKLVDVIKIER